MAYIQINNVAIRGIAGCVPERVVSNEDYPYLTPEEIGKYIATIGVRERHCAIPDGSICTSDLCYKSAEKLIEDLGWKNDDIQLLVFVSHTADYKLPSTACILQERLGLPTSTMAFDSPLGCSGFVYGLGMTASIMQTGYITRGLLLVGNTQSFYAAPKDQGTALLFADAGCAIALEFSREADPMQFDFFTNGAGKDALIVPDGGCRNPFTEGSLLEYTDEDGTVRTRLHEKMDGLEVFQFASRNVPRSVAGLMDKFGIDHEGVDYLLLHQANKFLCEKIRKRLRFSEDQTPYNIDRFGNTSGATIPLLMVTELGDRLREEKLSFLASGFGVGLSLGSVHFSTDSIVCPPLMYL
ncbi:MAG: ketoacyl-ACP synthase III [Muribaculaceae bacterium]|nr:ketoacyl-ACP synthase III [Muribaculaceae bacterium]